MKRASLTGLAVLLAATFAAAQAKPDFSGSWTLDKEKSTMPAMGGGGGGAGGGGRGGGGGAAEAITIKQTATELTITAGERVTIHKLDGTEYEMPGRAGGPGPKATSKWDGAKLVTSSTRPGRDGGEPITTTETRSLGADGTLVVDSVTKTAQGERVLKLVYKKG